MSFYKKADKVVVRMDNKIVLGAIENVEVQTPDPILKPNYRVVRYSVRSESGKLIDWVQVDIKDRAGYIDSKLTKSYFDKNTIPDIKISEDEDDSTDGVEMERRNGLFRLDN